MDVTLKISSENDLADLMPLVRGYHEFEQLALTELERENAVRRLITDRSLGAIWLVSGDGTHVGYIALCLGFSIEFAGFDAFIDEFYIVPEFRGKGIGTKAITLIKDEARKIGVRALHLEVARSNNKAHKFYTRVNFKPRDKYTLMSVSL